MSWAVSVVLWLPGVAMASALQLPDRCEPDGYIYQWRNAAGSLQMGDCAPEGISAVTRIPRSSLKPTLIQPPPRSVTPPRRPGKPRGTKAPPKKRQPSSEDLRALSAECRWLVGRIQHLKGLVRQHRSGSLQPSIWAPELRKRRAELRKARCDVKI